MNVALQLAISAASRGPTKPFAVPSLRTDGPNVN